MAAEVVTEDEARVMSRKGHEVNGRMGYDHMVIRWIHDPEFCDACENGLQCDPIPTDPDPTQMDLPF